MIRELEAVGMTKFRVLAITVLAVAVLIAAASPIMAGAKNECTKIQDGILTYPPYHYLAGQPLQVGYDIFGYNYQAHSFNEYFVNVYIGDYGLPPYQGDYETYLAEHPDATDLWLWPYRHIQLVMKWNDAYLSNTDCDGDGSIDRFYGHAHAIGSGALLTNHQAGTYIGDDGKEHQWKYFVKIVAAPTGAYKEDGVWYRADGTEIGPDFQQEFAIIQSVFNDPYNGAHGIERLSPATPGFGAYKDRK